MTLKAHKCLATMDNTLDCCAPDCPCSRDAGVSAASPIQPSETEEAERPKLPPLDITEAERNLGKYIAQEAHEYIVMDALATEKYAEMAMEIECRERQLLHSLATLTSLGCEQTDSGWRNRRAEDAEKERAAAYEEREQWRVDFSHEADTTQALRKQLLEAKAGESIQGGFLWSEYQKDTTDLTFSGWIRQWKARAEQAEARVAELIAKAEKEKP